MDSLVKFSNLVLHSSITYDSTNTAAVDISAPLSFIEWVQNFAGVSSEPKFLLSEYKNYINSWFSIRQTDTSTKQDIIKGLYVSLFKNIAVNYLTIEERRFVSNIDTTKATDIAAVMPLYVRKIKDLCLYYASLREKAKSAVYEHNIKGSNYGLEKQILDEIDKSFLNPKINKLFIDSGITADDIKSTISIDFEDLYDTETNYYDKNPNLPLSAYDSTTQSVTSTTNDYELDPNLFIDFDVSVVNAINQYPVILQELGENFSINLDFAADDLQYLKDNDFTTLVNDLDKNNLRINTLRDTLQHFSGTTFYFLSTNSVKNFSYGKLFEADSFANYLNRRFPTITSAESDKIVSESSVGRFFRPDKQGILNFLSFDVTGAVTNLISDTVYVFPDPNIYGNISGLSRTKLNTPFSFSDNVTDLKANVAVSFQFGEALSNFLTKFRGYQSRSESLGVDAEGISKVQDATDFFSGANKTTWANSDVFKLLETQALPIADRQRALLTNLRNKTLWQHKTDINNNEYALYKEIYTASPPQIIYQNEQGATITCLTLDAGTYTTNISSVSGVTLNTSSLSGLTAFDYFVTSIKFFPELDFYKTILSYEYELQDGCNFNLPDQYELITMNLSALNTAALSAMTGTDSGPFIVNENDASSINFARRYEVQNTFLGSTLSSAETQLASFTTTLCTDVALYNQQTLIGDWYFRSYNSTSVLPASAALSAIFTKYSAPMQSEIFTKTKSFDIVANTLIVETENYMFFEQLQYDPATYEFTPNNSQQLYISRGGLSAFNYFSNIWYNEADEDIFVCRTTILSALSTTNNKTIGFDIYRYNFDTLKQIYTTIGTIDMCLSGTPLSATNIIGIERPLLNYSNDTGKYSLKYLAKDVSNMFYDFNITFKLTNEKVVYDMQIANFSPDLYLHSENYTSGTFGSIIETKLLLPGETLNLVISGGVLIIN